MRRGLRVAAIEIDPGLVVELRERFAGADLRVVEGDVRERGLTTIADDAATGRAPSDLLVVANLPYAISKPVAQKIVAERAHVARAVLMFQREVAVRLTATPGTRDYGPLAVLCGQAYAIERLFDVPPRAFRPPPRVASCVTRWVRLEVGLDPSIEPALRACLTACFARRRQTLRNNLRAAVASPEAADRLLAGAGLDGTWRAEEVEPSGFLRLAAALRSARLV